MVSAPHQSVPQVCYNMCSADVPLLAANIGEVVKQSCKDVVSSVVRSEFDRLAKRLEKLERRTKILECASQSQEGRRWPRQRGLGDTSERLRPALDATQPRSGLKPVKPPKLIHGVDHRCAEIQRWAMDSVPGPLCESELSAFGKRLQKKSIIEPMGATTFLGHPSFQDPDVGTAGMDDEVLWRIVKGSSFYRNVKSCTVHFMPMPLHDWIKMLLLVPRAVQLVDFQRACDEEDTTTLINTVVKPAYSCHWGIVHLVFWAVVHPSSVVRTQWDLFVLGILFSVCIITPFLICFDLQVQPMSVLGVWEVVVDASFMVDMYLNFRTGFIRDDGGEILVSSYRAIAQRYFLGFFLIDCVSTVPWDLVLSNGSLGLVRLFKASKFVKLSRAIRILKIVRILRLLKAPVIMKRLEQTLGRSYVRIGASASLIIFILHVFACVFHYVAIVSEMSSTWIQASGIVNSESIWDRYVTSVYWAMSTMTTVGYGDVTPIQTTEKLIAMAGMLVGVTLFAYVTGFVGVLLSSFNAQSMRTQEQQRQLDSFCRAHKIPKALGAKLEYYFDHVMRRRIHKEDLLLVNELSGTLRQQVLLTMHANLFDKLPFMHSKHPQFLEQLIPFLKLEYYSSGEYVIWQGDQSTDMYFVGEGLLEVRVNVDVPRKPVRKRRAKPAQMQGVRIRWGRDIMSARRHSRGNSLERKAQALWRQHDAFKWHTARAIKRPDYQADLSLRERSVAAMLRPFRVLRQAIVTGDTALRPPIHSVAVEASPAVATPSASSESDSDLPDSTLRGPQQARLAIDASSRQPDGIGQRKRTDSSLDWWGKPRGPAADEGAAADAAAPAERGSAFLSVVSAAAKAAKDARSPALEERDSAAQASLRSVPVHGPGQPVHDTWALREHSTEAAAGVAVAGGAGGSSQCTAWPAGAGASGAEGEPSLQHAVGEGARPPSLGTDTWDASESDYGLEEHFMTGDDALDSNPGIVDRMIGIQAAPFKRVGKLQQGEYFGEIACWTGAARSASIVTITSCELYCLQRTALLNLAKEWPVIAKELKFTSDTAPQTMPTAEVAAAAAAAANSALRSEQSLQALKMSKRWKALSVRARAQSASSYTKTPNTTQAMPAEGRHNGSTADAPVKPAGGERPQQGTAATAAHSCGSHSADGDTVKSAVRPSLSRRVSIAVTGPQFLQPQPAPGRHEPERAQRGTQPGRVERNWTLPLPQRGSWNGGANGPPVTASGDGASPVVHLEAGSGGAAACMRQGAAASGMGAQAMLDSDFGLQTAGQVDGAGPDAPDAGNIVEITPVVTLPLDAQCDGAAEMAHTP
eukprot:jgi/Ulvmu1/888/UM100_0043.1